MPEPLSEQDEQTLAQMSSAVIKFFSSHEKDPDLAIPLLIAQLSRRVYALAWDAVREFCEHTENAPPHLMETLVQSVFQASRADQPADVTETTLKSLLLPWVERRLRVPIGGERIPLPLSFGHKPLFATRKGRSIVLLGEVELCNAVARKIAIDVSSSGLRVLWLMGVESKKEELPVSLVTVARSGWRHKIQGKNEAVKWLAAGAKMFGGVSAEMLVLDGAEMGKLPEYAGRPLEVVAAEVVYNAGRAMVSTGGAVVATVATELEDVRLSPSTQQLRAFNECYLVREIAGEYVLEAV